MYSIQMENIDLHPWSVRALRQWTRMCFRNCLYRNLRPPAEIPTIQPIWDCCFVPARFPV